MQQQHHDGWRDDLLETRVDMSVAHLLLCLLSIDSGGWFDSTIFPMNDTMISLRFIASHLTGVRRRGRRRTVNTATAAKDTAQHQYEQEHWVVRYVQPAANAAAKGDTVSAAE